MAGCAPVATVEPEGAIHAAGNSIVAGSELVAAQGGDGHLQETEQ